MPTVSEPDMRKAEAPTPDTTAELATYIDGLLAQEHDYGTCVYAMSLAATAAFNMVAHKLGCTGFQASCADMDILRRTRSLDGPFMLINLANLIYPQYDLRQQLEDAIAETLEKWAPEKARELLAESPDAHPNVLAHWRRLAAAAKAEAKS